MKEQIKSLLKVKNLVAIAFGISILANAYFFGTKWLANQRLVYINSGVMVVRNFIVKEATEKGRVTIQDDKGKTVILVPEIKQ